MTYDEVQKKYIYLQEMLIGFNGSSAFDQDKIYKMMHTVVTVVHTLIQEYVNTPICEQANMAKKAHEIIRALEWQVEIAVMPTHDRDGNSYEDMLIEEF